MSSSSTHYRRARYHCAVPWVAKNACGWALNGYTCGSAEPADTLAVAMSRLIGMQRSTSIRPGTRSSRDTIPQGGWAWCYVDEAMIDLGEDTTPHNGPIPRYVQ
jgi:hypothetical protein